MTYAAWSYPVIFHVLFGGAFDPTLIYPNCIQCFGWCLVCASASSHGFAPFCSLHFYFYCLCSRCDVVFAVVHHARCAVFWNIVAVQRSCQIFFASDYVHGVAASI